MSQLCLRRNTTAWSRKEALAVARSFIPNQAATVLARMKGTHTKPAFCSHRWPPRPSTSGCGSPPSAPNTPTVTASGTTNCMAETPRFPSPALRPSAVPFCALGKKKLMFDMLEAKFPPPRPHRSASTSMVP